MKRHPLKNNCIQLSNYTVFHSEGCTRWEPSRRKTAFQTHGMLYEDGEITDAWSSLDYDWDRLGSILMEDLCENESVAVLSAVQG